MPPTGRWCWASTTGAPTPPTGSATPATSRIALSGSVLNSPAEAVVEIGNPFLGTTLRLDLSNQWNPRRTSETGDLEEAGGRHEVWLDFDWRGPSEGDFYRPFSTLEDAAAAVADAGVIRIAPGSTRGPLTLAGSKRFRLVAPIGGVSIGRP